MSYNHLPQQYYTITWKAQEIKKLIRESKKISAAILKYYQLFSALDVYGSAVE